MEPPSLTGRKNIVALCSRLGSSVASDGLETVEEEFAFGKSSVEKGSKKC